MVLVLVLEERTLPLERDPRPVYIVPRPQPKSRGWLVSIGVIALVMVGAAALGQQRLASQSPGASGAPAYIAPAVDYDAIRAAVRAASDRQVARMDAKLAECDGLEGAAWDKCDKQWSALDRQYDALIACTDAATSVAQVTACERKVGIH